MATPIFFGNLGVFVASCGWGYVADRWGRRWAMIVPALIAVPLTPLYLFNPNIL